MSKILLASPHMGGTEIKYVQEAFDTNWIAPAGPNLDQFEKSLSAYTGAGHSLALSSGTSAIHLSLIALGVQKGDVVFCSALTFSASANPIIYQGATPVFIDSTYESWNMSPRALLKAFQNAVETNRMPKAVIIVHLYGQSADMEPLKTMCDMYGVPIIEDAAESLGATYQGIQTGTMGELGVFSFNGNKIITTSGGGMLVSNDKDHIDKARKWASQSREKELHYEHKELGYNYRMSNVSAGIGRGQMEVLDLRISQKKRIFEIYQDEFKNYSEIEMMPICETGKSNYWLTAITFDTTEPLKVIEALERENIEARPVWKPMHMQPFFKQAKMFSALELGNISQDLYNRGICLPSDTKMTQEQQEKVMSIIKGAVK